MATSQTTTSTGISRHFRFLFIAVLGMIVFRVLQVLSFGLITSTPISVLPVALNSALMAVIAVTVSFRVAGVSKGFRWLCGVVAGLITAAFQISRTFHFQSISFLAVDCLIDVIQWSLVAYPAALLAGYIDEQLAQRGGGNLY